MKAEDYHARWEQWWSEGVAPGSMWDAKMASQSFAKLLKSVKGQELVKGKEAVVPGCGRGYDVVLLEKSGAAKVVGVEISASAAKVANEFCKREAQDASKVEVVVADWLMATDLQLFDVGYDYTFFCALHPDMRKNWGEAWHRHLKPGGALITLVFPLEPNGREGPPWPVQKEAYEDVLLPLGFECMSYEKVELRSDAGREDRVGKEAIAVWLRG